MADVSSFDKIRIGIASPLEMRQWSYGEVKKPETINYRTFKPERDGLFCERIFGPIKDWECHCGRYKKVKFKGIICDRCGVEVTRSKVRRERMGHIELAAPVCHIWYLKGVPSPLSLILDISPRPLEKVLYFASYVITHVDRRKINEELDGIRHAVDTELAAMEREHEEALEKISRDSQERLQDEIAALTEPPEEDEEEEAAAEGEASVLEADAEAEAEVEARPQTPEEIEAARAQIETKVRNEERQAKEREERGHRERAEELRNAVKLLESIEKRQLIPEDQFRSLEKLLEIIGKRLEPERDTSTWVRAGLGAAAVKELLGEIDLDKLARELRQEIAQTQGPRRARAIKRLEIVEAFLKSKARPEWMILDVVPVIPPELRPMVQLDGGRFATSDLNDLYRRIINRNNRLKKIVEIRAPESIVNHEKRLLQEAVDALIDNGRRTRPVVGSNNRPLRSLSDMLKGKEGRFRKNLLGKRVDYSGRSVIVVGPHLHLHQCGLPKEMALELFKPFVMKMLVETNATSNIKTAKRMIDRMNPQVWDALERVISEHPVLLNRAPTLHRLGIQAFEPVLVDGKAIQVHPLVCHAFNADFDGDQMAVHVPLSEVAQAEARVLMLSTQNLFSPAHGGPIVAPIQDIVLGLYYLTESNETAQGAGAVYTNPQEAILAYESGAVALHAPVKCRVPVYGEDASPLGDTETRGEGRGEISDNGHAELAIDSNGAEPAPVSSNGASPEPSGEPTVLGHEVIETTIGRLILSEVLPERLRYRPFFMKKTLDKKGISEMVSMCHREYGAERTIRLLDEAKALGFRFATRSGITISMTDMDVPARRDQIIQEAEGKVEKANRDFKRGLLTQDERRQRVLSFWQQAATDVGDAIMESIDRFNPVYMITNSGARGSKRQITQLSGMRGLMSNPFGALIEDLPIKSNFHEGLSVLEYFVSTHGARKGLADTALRTADAGYLTRRLVDVAQDVIVRAIDCGTHNGIYVGTIRDGRDTIEHLSDRIKGRTTLTPIDHPETGERLIDAGEEISDEMAVTIEEAGIKEVGIRSPLACELRQGICAQCYGRDLATGRRVEVGTAVGIIAAQSIGEPGTQLTMRTFHSGGIAMEYLTGVAEVKKKKQETLKQLHSDIEEGLVSLEEGAERERVKAVQAVLKVLEEQVRGLLRVVELFEARKPKGQAIISEIDGVVSEIESTGLKRVVIHAEIDISNSVDKITGETMAEDVVDTASGEVVIEAGKEITDKVAKRIRELGFQNIKVRKSHLVPYRGYLEVEKGTRVIAGDRLTEGPLDPQKVLDLQGVRGVQEYLVREIQVVYKSQGVDINDKHVEIIVRQMLKKRKIRGAGDSDFLPGQVVDKFEFEEENRRVRALDPPGTEATADWLLLGITEASLATDSFLSAASFQKTTRVLTEAAVRGKRDNLVGLKENVIIGRLIPAGTGLPKYRDLDIAIEQMDGSFLTVHTAPKEPTFEDMEVSEDGEAMAAELSEPDLRTMQIIDPATEGGDGGGRAGGGLWDSEGGDGDGAAEESESDLGLGIALKGDPAELALDADLGLDEDGLPSMDGDDEEL
jgi:DNA-directed RNA polymerase subunit beta'